jgi:hypothetical protein
MIKSLKNLDRVRVVKLKQIYSDPLIKMKKYDGAYTQLGPGIDAHGNPVTGLTEDRIIRDDKGKETEILGTRKEMETMLDLADGTLKNTGAFWLAYNIRLGSDPLELDLQDPHDLLRYLFAHAQTIVADGLKAIGDSSKMEYVLYSEEQAAEERVVERRTLREAYVLADKLDLETKVNILSVYGMIVDASSVNTIEDKIGEKIEENPKKFMEMVSDEDLVYRSLVTKALDKGVLIMKDGSIFHGEVNVGYDRISAAKAIAKNITLQAVLKAKMSGDMDLIAEALSKKKTVGKPAVKNS